MVVKFRSTKNLDEQAFIEHLGTAPWHVGEIFNDIEDQTYLYSYEYLKITCYGHLTPLTLIIPELIIMESQKAV